MNVEEQLEILLKHCSNLHIDNKHIRKKTLTNLRIEIFQNKENETLRKIFDQTYMYILKCFSDSSESCREEAISIMQEFVINLEKNDYYLTYIFPVLEKRLAGPIIVEESEEIRLQLVTFIHTIIQKYQDNLLVPFLDICAEILSKTVLDPFPKVKHESCLCIRNLTKALPRHFHLQSEKFLKAVVQLLSHQHFRIRVVAIQCISDIVIHSGGKISEDALVGLAVAMNDGVPTVRLTVIRTAHAWLLKQPDRYSYFPKILPLILLGLSDEVEVNATEALKLWKEAGKQYADENEQEMKDKIDFLEEIIPRYPININERPTIGCRMLVIRHTMQLLSAIIQELNDWRVEIRRMSARLLCSVVLHNESDITQHLQNLLPAMAKACRDTDSEVANNVQKAAHIVGYFILPEVYCDIILPVLDGHTGPTIGQIRVLGGLISGSLGDNLVKKLEIICATLLKSDVCQSRLNSEDLLKCCQQIINVCQEKCENVDYELFTIIVTIFSLNKEPITSEAENVLTQLTKALKLQSVDELYKKHSSTLLYAVKPSSNTWTVVTPERCIFETLLIKSKSNFKENFRLVLDILLNALDVNNDGETRLKLFLALSTILIEIGDMIQIDDDNEFSENMETLIMNVIVPNLVWHAGRLSESIRSAAIVCLCSCLPFCANRLPLTLFTTLVGLLEERSSATRTLVLRAVGCIAEFHQNQLDSEMINSIYPELLKRLDDAIDDVRIEAAITQKKIWDSLNQEMYHGTTTHSQHVDFLYSTLLIHLDDQNSTFQQYVFDVLKTVSKLNRALLREKLRKNRDKFRDKEICDNLIIYLESA